MLNNVQSGLQGQDVALRFLQSKGMSLADANFRVRRSEIDLIMKDGAYIVFVEVKYRRGVGYGYPGESVNISKQKRIKNAALHYIAYKNLHNNDFRFDVVEVLEESNGMTINHIEDAFW